MCNQDTIETKPIEMIVTASEEKRPTMPVITSETPIDKNQNK